jgi:hypothetical protein
VNAGRKQRSRQRWTENKGSERDLGKAEKDWKYNSPTVEDLSVRVGRSFKMFEKDVRQPTEASIAGEGIDAERLNQ